MQSGKEGIPVLSPPEHAAASLSPARNLVALPFLEEESCGSEHPPEKREILPTAPLLFCRTYKWLGLPVPSHPSFALVETRALCANPSPTTILPCSVAWDIAGLGHSLLPLLTQGIWAYSSLYTPIILLPVSLILQGIPSEFELLCSLLLAALQRNAHRSDIPRPEYWQAASTAARETTPCTMGYQVTTYLSQRGDRKRQNQGRPEGLTITQF